MILSSDVGLWPKLYRELFEERAALMTFDGGLPKHEAELVAESDIRRVAEKDQGEYAKEGLPLRFGK